MNKKREQDLTERVLETAERTGILRAYKTIMYPIVNRLFFMHLILETRNFSNLQWMGHSIWQNLLDLWVIQETLSELKPDLLIETGTHHGGSALFCAQLFDLIGSGKVISIDIENLRTVAHPRIDFIAGSSTSEEVLRQVREAAGEVSGPVMVILDSDHNENHVLDELEKYCEFVTLGSYMLAQDGIIDKLPVFRYYRPGPYPAIKRFLGRHPEFVVDEEREQKFLITHHPSGWLRRTNGHV